jgi:hypothetical protein
MPTFTPDTYTDAPPVEKVNHGPDYSLWRYYGGREVEYVVIITSGAANASPGSVSPTVAQKNAADSGSGENDKGIFYGGRTYTVTAGEDTILTAAGYTVT